VRNISEVAAAIAQGDLSKTITVEVKGEMLELKRTINGMVGQLRSRASDARRGEGSEGAGWRRGGRFRCVEGADGKREHMGKN
jgi:hypothetical protein